MATLPWDAIVNILSRLDVDDLLRYKCVSKSWCSLINDPYFIKMHLNHSMQTSSHLSLIRGDLELHSLDLDIPDSAAVLLNAPIHTGGYGIKILGRCNGLVALGSWVDREMALWNPSTRKFMNVPISGLLKLTSLGSRKTLHFGYIGFGYDPVNDDHKLLTKVHYFNRRNYEYHSEVKVYSVKTKTWKRVVDFPRLLFYYPGYIYGALASNCLHWKVKGKLQSSRAVAFDLVTEEYREFSMPAKQECCKDESLKTTLTELGEWLCVVHAYKKDRKVVMVDHVDIWVMKEYGVEESWTKLFSVVPSSATGVFGYLKPLAYLKSSHMVLLGQDGKKKLLMYDLERKRAESVREIAGINVPTGFDRPFVSVRSLVGFGGGDGDNNWER